MLLKRGFAAFVVEYCCDHRLIVPFKTNMHDFTVVNVYNKAIVKIVVNGITQDTTNK